MRIRVTDSGGNPFEKAFLITLTNVFTDDDDQDGLTEAEEIQLGTDPLSRDTDQDVSVRDKTPITDEAPRFMRLKVEKLGD